MIASREARLRRLTRRHGYALSTARGQLPQRRRASIVHAVLWVDYPSLKGMTERLVTDEVLAGTLIHHLDDAAGAEANSNAILEASSLQTYRSLLLASSDAVSRHAVGTLIACPRACDRTVMLASPNVSPPSPAVHARSEVDPVVPFRVPDLMELRSEGGRPTSSTFTRSPMSA